MEILKNTILQHYLRNAVILFIRLVMLIGDKIFVLRKKRFSILVLLFLLVIPSAFSAELSDMKYCFDWEGATESAQMKEKINSFQCNNVGTTVESEHFLDMGQKSVLGAGDQYIWCDSDNVTPAGFQKLTACAWFNITGAEGAGTDSYIIGTRGSNRPFLMLSSVYPSYKRVYITIDSDTSSPEDIDTPYNSYLFGALKDFFCVVWNGTHVLKYRQGLANGTPTVYSGNYLATTNSEFYIGRQGTSYGTDEFIGHIGDIYLWNGTLTPAQILDLYQNPRKDCSEFISTPPAPLTPLLSVYASNASHPSFGTHKFVEGTNFFPYANFTYNGSVLSSASCNFSYKNVSEMGYYNSTKKVYLNNTGYVDSAHGITNLTAFCKQESYNSTGYWYIDIGNVAPVVSINDVKDADGNVYAISEGAFIEYIAGIYLWNITIEDDDLDYYIITLSNSSDIISSGASLPFSNDALLFVDFHQNPFNISVFANDTAGDFSYQSFTFNLSDTGMPSCSNLGGGNLINGTTHKFNSTCTDEYFFSLNVSCSNGFSYYKQDIDNQTFNWINSTVVNGYFTCDYQYCDGHTEEVIPELESKLSFDSLAGKPVLRGAKIDGYDIKSDVIMNKVETVQKIDRVTFCFDSPEDGYSIEIPEGCYPAKDSKWKSHLLCPDTKTWIDFENEQGADVNIIGSFVEVSNAKGNVCFDSVGKFNCVNISQEFNVTYPFVNSTSRLKIGFCPDTGASVAILGIILFFFLGILILGLAFQITIFSYAAGFSLMVVSFSVIDCSPVIGLCFLITGLISVLVGFTTKS